jgi:putative tryptophan/tyrosine transport system substrate-binding protein
MDWRNILVLGGLLAASLAAVVEAQQPKVPKIGVLSLDFPNSSTCVDEIRLGLDGLGYVEGRTYVIEPRWAEDRADLLPSLAADLVRAKVDLIVSASGPAALIVKEATSSIPVVLASSFYPVESGVVASLNRPGGNVTGVTHFTPELMAKRVQLLKEIVPNASRFAVLRLPGRLQDLVVKDMEAAARELGVHLQVIEVRGEGDFSAAFDAAVAARAQGVMSTQGPLFWHNNVRIAQLALQHRLPSLSGEPGAADAGALLFYGPNVFEGCRRAVRYIDQILKGAKPAELPIEQPTKIALVINFKTAKTLGLNIPASVLARADEVIQ